MGCCLLLLSGCDRPATNNQALIEGLRESSQLLAAANDEACRQMANEAYRDYASPKHDLWLPKAVASRKEAVRLISWLQQLEQQAQSREDNTGAGWMEKISDSVYERILRFRDTVLTMIDTAGLSGYTEFLTKVQADRSLRSQQFAHRFNLPTGEDLPASMPQYLLSFTEVDKPAQVFVLLQAAVNRTAYELTDYCRGHVPVMGGGYSRVSMVAHASSSAVKAGQTIEVTAGIVEFALSRKPVIVIGGAVRNQNKEGRAQYSFVAMGKPGKYQLPVVISFEKPDGARDSVFKTIDYVIVQ